MQVIFYITLLLAVNVYSQSTVSYSGDSTTLEGIALEEFPVTVKCPVKSGRVRWLQTNDITKRSTMALIFNYAGEYVENTAKAELKGKNLIVKSIPKESMPFDVYCQGEDTKEMYVINLSLKVYTCPPATLSINDKQLVNITCSLSGIATPHYEVDGLKKKVDFIEYVDNHGEEELFDVVLSISGSPDIHGKEARCVEGNSTKCTTVLDVKYGVNKVTVKPTGELVRIGDVIECHGNGNPKSLVQFFVNGKTEGKSGENIKMTVKEPKNEKARKFKVTCEATNSFKSKKVTASMDMEYNVIVSNENKESAAGAASIVIGIIIATIVVLLVGVVIYFVMKNRRSHKIPHDAKRVPTENEEFSTELKGGITA